MEEPYTYALNMGLTDFCGPVFLVSLCEFECSLYDFEINS